MALIATEQRIGRSEQPTPHGLWAALARRADAPTVGVGDVWRGLERRLLTEAAPPKRSDSWAALAARADPTQYRPHAVPDVAEEQIVEGEQTYTVIRSPRGNYLRLTPPQRELWHQMDGTRTVAQLATQAFLTFKQLLPVGDLVTTLKAEGFLIDQPVWRSSQWLTARAAITMVRWASMESHLWWSIGRARRSVLDIRKLFSICHSWW